MKPVPAGAGTMSKPTRVEGPHFTWDVVEIGGIALPGERIINVSDNVYFCCDRAEVETRCRVVDGKVQRIPGCTTYFRGSSIVAIQYASGLDDTFPDVPRLLTRNFVPRLILLVGLPMSGKSQLAASLGYPIVNPDSIRLGIHGQAFFAPAEPLVWTFTRLMVTSLFEAGHKNVVLDACNVSEKRRAEWKDDRWTLDVMVCRTSTEECLRRAHAENRGDLVPVISRMARAFDFPGWHPGVPT